MNRILAIRHWASPMMERIHPRHLPDAIETASWILSAGLLVGAVLGGGAFLAQASAVQADKPVMQSDMLAEITPAKYVRPNPAPTPVSSPRRVWVDPPPPAAEQPQSAANTDKPATAPAEPVPQAAKVTKTVSSNVPPVPTDCLPASLRSVLKDVEARFGAVMMVSTTELHTDNHSPGSVRHKLHAACKAIDFKVRGDRKGVVAYLRARPEVAGVNTYGNNGVIHMDHNEVRQLANR